MAIFGDIERFVSELYPYRWPIAAVLALLALAVASVGYRYGWHRTLWRRRKLTAAVGLPAMIVAIPLAYYLLSPLWTRTTIVEESPLAAVAASNNVRPATTTATIPPAATPSPTTRPATATQPAGEPTATVETAEPDHTSTPESAIEPTIEPTPEAPIEPTSEPTPEPFTPRLVSSGALSGADDFHFAEGTVQLIETAPGTYVVRLENFSVRNGPDLFVYLANAEGSFDETALNLGDLRATDGSINYDVPPGTDISQFGSVIIWCRAFAVLFATAPLVSS